MKTEQLRVLTRLPPHVSVQLSGLFVCQRVKHESGERQEVRRDEVDQSDTRNKL